MDRLNQPRFATLPNIMKAKKKPMEVLSPDALKVEVKERLQVLQVVDPPKRQGGKKVDSVEALVDKLKNEAGVI